MPLFIFLCLCEPQVAISSLLGTSFNINNHASFSGRKKIVTAYKYIYRGPSLKGHSLKKTPLERTATLSASNMNACDALSPKDTSLMWADVSYSFQIITREVLHTRIIDLYICSHLYWHTVKPALKTSLIQRPPAYKEHIFHISNPLSCIFSM